MIFLTALAFLFVHELDAIHRGEWRFFFAHVPVSDAVAYQIFTALHAPLFVWIVWAWSSTGFQTGFSAFLIVHAGLHFALRNHPLIDFNNAFSALWVYGGAVLAALHLILQFT